VHEADTALALRRHFRKDEVNVRGCELLVEKLAVLAQLDKGLAVHVLLFPTEDRKHLL